MHVSTATVWRMDDAQAAHRFEADNFGPKRLGAGVRMVTRDSTPQEHRPSASPPRRADQRHIPVLRGLLDFFSVLLAFWTSDSQSVYILPLNGDRKPIAVFQGRGGRISPDGRYIAYSWNGGGGPMITYLRALNLSDPAASKPVQVHKDPALGGVMWRAD